MCERRDIDPQRMARVAMPVRKKSKKTEARHRQKRKKKKPYAGNYSFFSQSPHVTHTLALPRIVISLFLTQNRLQTGFPRWYNGKEPHCNARDPGSLPGSGRSPGGGHGNPLQYSCLENPMDRGAWWATVHGVTKSWTRLSTAQAVQYMITEKPHMVNRPR